MRSELAERLLGALMDWDVPRFTEEVSRVQALAALKYDEYGGYGPGTKFAENLARWLEQFDDPAERDVAYRFVVDRLVFISDAEIDHLIAGAYPDVLEPRLLAQTAQDLGEAPSHVETLAASPTFRSLRRRCLLLGLSDGAHLDRLRRASPGLSHEQFAQDYEVTDSHAQRLQTELGNALALQSLPGEPKFADLILVDDFSGSGRTLLRADEKADDGFKGKLWRFHHRIVQLKEIGVVADDARVAILLYAASEEALEHLTMTCHDAGLEGWSTYVIQQIPRSLRVDRTDPAMAALCQNYYDPASADEHKKDTPLGFQDCALPLVLSHNTPNNSVCLLWSETDAEGALGRRALFPRYERHHRDRP
jgi:hypothetical protein